ncbi:hypothetical protein ACHAPT_012355 [Fusarium lateritium]
MPQCPPSDADPEAPRRWYIPIHDACDQMATRAMETSPGAGIRCLDDLWAVLDLRCRITLKRDYMMAGFVPYIPEIRPRKRITLGTKRYYVAESFFQPDTGSWDEDPLFVPDLTAHLLSSLEQIKPTETTDRAFCTRVVKLPPEIQDMIVSFLLRGNIGPDCTYLLPQSHWMRFLLEAPFLWDLDKELIHAKALQGNEWDWEKLARQVLSRPTMVNNSKMMQIP